MANVRSIALLDTFRKILTKTLSMRLDIIFSTNNDTLCPQNYCGLPGDSTSTPIHVLNNIIEYAKTNNKQLWIMFQDISKAFDSISITGLDLALRRLALHDRLVDLVIEIFNGRNARILIAFGPTRSFNAGDGKSVTVTAYTAFIETSKERMQEVLNIANSFYAMMDININVKKCDLLSKEYKGWQAAKIIEKSHNSESLTVEICHITEFEPQLGNLYRLEKPNSKITKVIHRRAARVVNQTIDNGPVTINTPMNITDSQQLRSISTINKWESDTDNYIMMDHVQPIKENRNTEWVVKENNLDLNLHKVKGHSGNLWNDKVDELAKQASSSTSASNIVQFNQGHDGLNFVPMINEVPVEQKLRKFVKNVMNFVNDGQWSQLSCNQDALLDRTKDYDWDITWNALKQVKHFKCTSSKHNKL
ncbi:hypothetical protein RhiirC2_787778 [Rhizophagus irregularis]|uniref:Uncharacterized protein n=1 Tax=Rhizophagus irregularis TaxID=588596 RepID=A0A2N1MRK2_9GLOM|nr:hypothetical protein RhiirC2_787778 [Rhizophagus irregularis]